MGIVEEKETDVIARFLQSIWFNPESSRCCVSLPWRMGVGILADNYELSFLSNIFAEILNE